MLPSDKVVCICAFPAGFKTHFDRLPKVGWTYCVERVIHDAALSSVGLVLVGITPNPDDPIMWSFPIEAFKRVGSKVDALT